MLKPQPTKGAKPSTQQQQGSDDDKSKSPSMDEFNAMKDMLNQTIAGVGQLNQVVAGLSNSISEGFSKIQAPAPAHPNPEPEPVDLDQLSRKDFASFLVKTISTGLGKQIDEALKPVLDQVQDVKKTTVTSDIKQQYKELKSEHRDVDQWGAEIKAMAERHPNATLKELYTLAKNSDPMKAKEIDEKLKEEDEKSASNNQQGDDGKRRYGGMTPQSNGSPMDFLTNLDKDAAAEAAWAESGLDDVVE